eukprot:scaffold334_cov241-Pinguiococcus_pyrenoidosus.AAC.20
MRGGRRSSDAPPWAGRFHVASGRSRPMVLLQGRQSCTHLPGAAAGAWRALSASEAPRGAAEAPLACADSAS